MKKEEILKILQDKIPAEILNLPGKQITVSEPLISSGLIDSFSLVDIAMLVEDAFGVIIEDTELNADSFDTLEALAEMIIGRM